MARISITDILDLEKRTANDIIGDLKHKSIDVPSWDGENGLEKEYNPKLHPVMNTAQYPDVVTDGKVQRVTRVPLNFQKLASKRMSELCFGIPAQRVYKPANERQKEVAKYLEKIFNRINIDDVNTDRARRLYAGCEYVTLWFAQEAENNLYGFDSRLKLRCRTFSPMLGDKLYPLFDEYGDLIALSIEYIRKVGKSSVTFFDTYTANRHVKWSNENSERGMVVVEDEAHELGKIPAVYMSRPEPVWEDTSPLVYEMEWSLSRNGNYLRKNSKPVFYISADANVQYGKEKSEEEEYRSIVQVPQGGSLGYATWSQATESLKFHVSELRQLYFTQLQLPDWSYEKMSQQALSGESRKQLFIDARLKVGDESGSWRKTFDRELNVVKAFLKTMLPDAYAKDIDALVVENKITPFAIDDEGEKISNLTAANGGKALMSQRESIEEFGHSADVDKTMKEIEDEDIAKLENPMI